MRLMRKLLLGMLWLVSMYFAGMTLPGCVPQAIELPVPEGGGGGGGGRGGGGGTVGLPVGNSGLPMCWGDRDLKGVEDGLNSR